MKFNAGDIAGEEFDSATLTLFISEMRSAGKVEIYAITASWPDDFAISGDVTARAPQSSSSAEEPTIQYSLFREVRAVGGST